MCLLRREHSEKIDHAGALDGDAVAHNPGRGFAVGTADRVDDLGVLAGSRWRDASVLALRCHASPALRRRSDDEVVA